MHTSPTCAAGFAQASRRCMRSRALLAISREHDGPRGLQVALVGVVQDLERGLADRVLGFQAFFVRTEVA